jgi:acetyltransferase-like isoleucine patch superfamily enzyme
MRRLWVLVDNVFLAIAQNFPGEAGFKLRYAYWKRHLKFLGRGTRIACSVQFQTPSLISIGDHSLIDTGCILLAGRPVAGDRRIIRGPTIVEEGCISLGNKIHVAPYAVLSGMGGLRVGDNSGIGSKVSIYSYTHISLKPVVLYLNSIDIGNNVVVGTNSSLVCVPRVEDGTIIKPNSFLSGVLISGRKRDQKRDGAE